MNILVVDDEADVKSLFEQRFRKEIKNKEVQFEFALSAEQALVHLGEQANRVILILSDINMPGMSGLELLQLIKQQYRAMQPVFMMVSAYNDSQNIQRAKQLGADDFLTKPLDFNHLKEKLKHYANDKNIGC